MARWARTATTAAVAARLAWALLRSRPPGGTAEWDRGNHRGETVTLLEGPAYALGAACAVAVAPGVPARVRAAGVLATLGAGAFGAVDDLRETGRSKGLRGHLGELAHGHVTTGGLKVLGIGVTGLLAAGLGGRPPAAGAGRATSSPGGRLDLVLGGAVIAGSANLVNLFDLRPGRALKVVLLASASAGGAVARHGPAAGTAGGPPAGHLVAAAAGSALALLAPDLAERAMLGDTGANAAGALLGTAAVAGRGRRGRLAVLAVLAGLTLASERVSFTAVIARTPVLRELDALGRRPR